MTCNASCTSFLACKPSPHFSNPGFCLTGRHKEHTIYVSLTRAAVARLARSGRDVCCLRWAVGWIAALVLRGGDASGGTAAGEAGGGAAPLVGPGQSPNG